jgi:hypothetical protein
MQHDLSAGSHLDRSYLVNRLRKYIGQNIIQLGGSRTISFQHFPFYHMSSATRSYSHPLAMHIVEQQLASTATAKLFFPFPAHAYSISAKFFRIRVRPGLTERTLTQHTRTTRQSFSNLHRLSSDAFN